MKLFDIETVLSHNLQCGVSLVRMEFAGNCTHFKFWFNDRVFHVSQVVEDAIRDYWKAIAGTEIGEIFVDWDDQSDDVYGTVVHVTIFDKES